METQYCYACQNALPSSSSRDRGPLKLAVSAVRGHCVAGRDGQCVLDLAKDTVACGTFVMLRALMMQEGGETRRPKERRLSHKRVPSAGSGNHRYSCLRKQCRSDSDYASARSTRIIQKIRKIREAPASILLHTLRLCCNIKNSSWAL